MESSREESHVTCKSSVYYKYPILNKKIDISDKITNIGQGGNMAVHFAQIMSWYSVWKFIFFFVV